MDLDHVFSYHAPQPGQAEKYEELRRAAKGFAATIECLTPASADQSAALRHVREALMTANAAIALDGRLNELPEDKSQGPALRLNTL